MLMGFRRWLCRLPQYGRCRSSLRRILSARLDIRPASVQRISHGSSDHDLTPKERGAELQELVDARFRPAAELFGETVSVQEMIKFIRQSARTTRLSRRPPVTVPTDGQQSASIGCKMTGRPTPSE
jgi:hypothetical protein